MLKESFHSALDALVQKVGRQAREKSGWHSRTDGEEKEEQNK